MRKSGYVFAFQLLWLPEWVFRRNNDEAIASAFYDRAIDKSTFSQSDLFAYQKAATKPGTLTSTIHEYRNVFKDFFQPKSWRTLDIPILIIWGKDDIALGKELTHGTEAYVRDLKINDIPNCSHWVQQEQPQPVNRYIREFLVEFDAI